MTRPERSVTFEGQTVTVALLNRKGSEIGRTKLDRQDFDRLEGSLAFQTKGYVKMSISQGAGQLFKYLLLHRWIMGASAGLQVDHINNDKLDNRRQNLRLVTNTQNQQNRLNTRSNTGIRGVTFDARRNKFRATLKHAGKMILSESFDALEAAQAAVQAARARHLPYSSEAGELLKSLWDV